MTKPLFRVSAVAWMLCCAATAHAWHLEGRVYCEGTGQPLANIEIQVVSIDGPGFSGSATTDESGFYFIPLPNDPQGFRATAVLGSDETVVSPPSGEFVFLTTDSDFEIHRNWVIASPACAEERCWLTGGGRKFSPFTHTNLGTCGRHSYGGNVNPGCNTDAGEGGQWNDVAHDLRLHFQGIAIRVVRCGNVDGIPPGSDSPETPFNFIEFEGSGRLQGIQGNKTNLDLVYFFARCEDRNEPGSRGQNDGAFKDRYFLHVFSNPGDPAGSTLLLVDDDGDAETVDPCVVTTGNLQIHISSCDNPPVGALSPAIDARLQPSAPTTESEAAVTDVSLAIGPNPVGERTVMRFELPREAQATLAVYDVTGREVNRLAHGRLPAGSHAVVWNRRDRNGSRVGGGIYFVRLEVGGTVCRRHIAVLD